MIDSTPTTMEISTVPTHYVSATLDALSHRGIDKETILHKIGFSEELLNEEKARIPRSDYLRFTGYLALKLQDESFGLLKDPMRPGTFAMLCHSCINCATLGHFLKRLAKNAAIANSNAVFQLTLHEGQAIFTVKPQPGQIYGEDLYVMLALAVLHRLMAWVTDQTISLDEVNLRRERPFYASDYNLLFKTTINFKQPEHDLRFSADYLALRVVQDEQALCKFLKHSAVHLMSKPNHDDSLTSQISDILNGAIADQLPSFMQIAAELNCAPTTLKRKLLVEGSTYQNIKDAVRRDTAIHHLSQGNMSVDEIAAQAGFADPSSFFRAFRRWTGTSPRAYMR